MYRHYVGRSFNVGTNGPLKRVAVMNTWKLLGLHGIVVFYNRYEVLLNPLSLSKVIEKLKLVQLHTDHQLHRGPSTHNDVNTKSRLTSIAQQ